VVNVLGPKTKFLRADADSLPLDEEASSSALLVVELGADFDKTLDWWVPRLERIKQAISQSRARGVDLAGSGNDTELRHWQELALACSSRGATRWS
jgi:hypothetical protein